jgi:oxygen-independent coproporphyrinogen-3 oxidase
MFSLYVHIPYCQRRCPYCDFNAHAPPTWSEERYTATLLHEIHHAARSGTWPRDEEIATIFIGGGTPSLLSPDSIARILSAVRGAFAVTDDAEITMEANPGTVDARSLAGFRATGVNRISFGVQSLNDRHLLTLGRIHDADASRRAVGQARDAGFAAINTDFMFGVPGQSLEEWLVDLGGALALDPGHISAYNLTYEEGTAFHAWRAEGRLVAADEDDEVQMLLGTQRVLGDAGYEQYEISNYARPGRRCRHNVTYWRRQPYLGVGAGAHSFASKPAWGHRWANARPPELYMAMVEGQGHARASEEHPSREEAVGETLFLGLRLLEGIDVAAFAGTFGAAPDAARPALRPLVANGLLEQTTDRLRLTRAGLLHADSVFAALM